MEILVVAPVMNLKLEGINTIILNGFLLTNDKAIKDTLINNMSFVSGVGLNRLTVLFNNPIFYYKGEESSIPLMEGAENKSEDEKINILSKYLRGAIECLWYVKDNSVYVNQLYVQFNGEFVFETTTAMYMSDSSGTYNQTSFRG
jgi:hypothetical protein